MKYIFLFEFIIAIPVLSIELSGANPTKRENNSIVEDFSFYLCGLQDGMNIYYET